jgi:hypothetical protein
MKKIKQSPTDEQGLEDISAINTWFLTKSKMHLITFGFYTVIRSLDKDTLYLKLYYVKEKTNEYKDEIDRFVCKFYAHDRFKLKYSQCKIWHIPLGKAISAESIIKQADVYGLECLLESQIKENQLNGVFKDREDYTNNIPRSTDSNSSWYKYVYEPYVEGLNPKTDLEAKIIGNELILTWGYDLNGYQSSIAFEWRNILIHMEVNVIAKHMGRDDIFTFNVNGKFSRFGKASGPRAGFIGREPRINTLENYLSIAWASNKIEFKDNFKDGITPPLENENIFKVISIPMEPKDINQLDSLELNEQKRMEISYNNRIRKETGIITKYYW